MASNVPSVRFVQCPKCGNVVAKFTNFPVYECGGCGTILRAKYQIASIENASSGLHESSSKSTLDVESSCGVLEASGQDISLEVNTKASNCFFEANSSTSCNGKGESSRHGANGIDRAELSSRYGFDALERESSFDSEDYHSVQSWMEQRKFTQRKSPSRDAVVRGDSRRRPAKSRSLRPIHMKILKKVDELRDELSELFDQALEVKQKSHLRSIREEELTSKSVSQKPRKPKTNEHVLKGQDQVRKERRQPIRLHCRPVSGGAPFVICCKCLKLLQLPADFLVSSRTFHKLKCGSCSEIILYSFRARTPQAQHLATEADTSGCTREATIYSSALSFARSNSAVPEPVLHVSRSSSYQIEEQIDKQLKEARQLHCLMGYASASEILYQFSDSDGYQSTRPTTPQIYKPFEEFKTRDGIGETELRTGSDDLEGEYSNSMEIHEEDESPSRLRTRIGAPSLRLWLKKGMRELNRGLSTNLKIQSRI